MDYSGGVWFRYHKRPDGSPAEWPQCVRNRHGETIACQLLEGLGYEVIGQDCILMEEQEEPWSIVDVVAKDPSGETVLFEVETTYSDDPDALPDSDCEYNDKVQMTVAAKKYLEEHCEVTHVRHDYIAVVLLDGDKAKVTHTKGIAHAGCKENR